MPGMSTENAYVLDDTHQEYMLVSDSNEIGGQYDSKKVDYSELVELAQDNLFNKHLGIISTYLTNIQYNNYIQIINQRLKT